MTDEEIIANRDKRPRYRSGERVQIVSTGSTLDGWCGEVRGVDALQEVRGFVLTYVYRLRMDNLAMISMQEEWLQAAPAQEEGETQP